MQLSKRKILCAVIKPRDHINIQLSRQRLSPKSVKTRATMLSGIVGSKRYALLDKAY